MGGCFGCFWGGGFRGGGGGSGGCCDDGGWVHEFFKFLSGVVFKVFKVELAFEADGRPVANYVESFCTLGLYVVGDVDGFIVRTFNDFPVE